jgi:MtaA/CmuA family methyltransferase
MNGVQRITAALRGEWPDRTPVMLHSFMLAAREAGLTMQQFREKPRHIARAFIELAERYECDGVLVDIDTVTLAGAVGVPVDLPEDLPARSNGALLRDLRAVDDLEPVDISQDGRVQVWLEAAELLAQQVGEHVFVRGNCDQCPFSLAAAVRSIDAWMLDLADPDNEERIHKLLRFCTNVSTQFVELMAATGVHMVSNGDSPAGPELISPRLYRKYALPYEQRVARRAHELGLPYALHICGKTNLILDDMLASGAGALELDYKTDVHLAHDKMKSSTTFIGNVDPSGVLALGPVAMVEDATRAVLDVFADTPRFILNAGCAIPATAPPENIRAMIRVAHTAGSSIRKGTT